MEIKIGNNTFITPDSWNELSTPLPTKLLQALYFIFHADGLTPEFRLGEAGKLILNIGTEYTTAWLNAVIDQFGVTDGEAIFAQDFKTVIQAVTEPFVETDMKTFVRTKLNYTKCPFPNMMLPSTKGDRKLFACADGFARMPIGEFAQIDTLVRKYVKKNDKQAIHDCLSIIYRPHKEKTKANIKAKYHGDRRMCLADAEHGEKERAGLMNYIEEINLQILWFWITSCVEQIYLKNKNVMNPLRVEETKPNHWQKQLQKFGWAGLFFEIASLTGRTEKAVMEEPQEEFFLRLQYLQTKRLAEKNHDR
jgi:hypothetical protein